MVNYLAVLILLLPTTAHALTWNLDSKGEVTHAPHVVNPKVTDGLFRGSRGLTHKPAALPRRPLRDRR